MEKRKAMVRADECVKGDVENKRFHVSCFDTPSTATGGLLLATSSHFEMLGDLTNHNMLPQF
jgi:hypothetical protein